MEPMVIVNMGTLLVLIEYTMYMLMEEQEEEEHHILEEIQDKVLEADLIKIM